MKREQEANLCRAEALRRRAALLLQHNQAYPDGSRAVIAVIVLSLDSTCVWTKCSSMSPAL